MKVLFISLGCDKNLVDSEMMLGMLCDKKYEITDDENQADVVVVNTCCFIRDAKQESINTLLQMGELRKSGKIKALIATGCLTQRYQDEIQKEIPQVDAILGTTAFDEIVEAIETTLNGKNKNFFVDINAVPIAGKRRMLTTGGHFAYLKIAEGCNKRCSYCIIPQIRGNYRSVPMETLIEEAKGLAQSGVKELILVAQETTVYGMDLYQKKMLPTLLEKLCTIDDIVMIRILYCYPEEITDELIQVMKKEKKICHYLDMPIQHASDTILKRMGRKTNQADLRAIIAKLREEIPDICLRTTLISGFPQETGKEHKQLKQFVKEMRFERLGVFAYSAEEGTRAATMKGQIPSFIKEKRKREIMKLQQQIAFEKAAASIGKTMMAIVEGKLLKDNVFIGRTYKDAPNVDGYVFIHSERELITGDIVNVTITQSNEYDLIGEV